jgi:hypothetical protein
MINAYVEIGDRRTFAGAIEWPGWCRSGADEQSALGALLDYAPRYAAVLRASSLGFKAPTKLSELKVIERLKGSTTTDFGAPDSAPEFDASRVREAELRRYESLLRMCWQYFDATTRAARGKVLRSGPRGGGRNLEKMVEHVLGADEAYLGRLGLKFRREASEDVGKQLAKMRAAMLQGLSSAAHGEIPTEGPRGGRRWTPRYFVRRVAWHVLDHAWEIEDRMG